MTMEVEGKDSARFKQMVDRATALVRKELARESRLDISITDFSGPHLIPQSGAYDPLDFFELGYSEKAARNIPFLLIVTEVDLGGPGADYTLALPSPLINMAVVSTKRLDPEFWGEEKDNERAERRLATLLLHNFGLLVNLPAVERRDNYMFEYATKNDLDAMAHFDQAQWDTIGRNLPGEAFDRSTKTHRLSFAAKMLASNVPQIARALAHANPARLIPRLPTLIAAALSVIVVLLFSAETWDMAHAVSMAQVLLFSGIAIAASLYLLYRSFTLNALLGHDRALTESSVVSTAATFLSLLVTLVALYFGFGLIMYGAIVTVFPATLMDAWVSDGAASDTGDHVKLSMFLAGMGVLAGSLGGRSDSKKLIRGVLFAHER